jgi:hypothetical protein
VIAYDDLMAERDSQRAKLQCNAHNAETGEATPARGREKLALLTARLRVRHHLGEALGRVCANLLSAANHLRIEAFK